MRGIGAEFLSVIDRIATRKRLPPVRGLLLPAAGSARGKDAECIRREAYPGLDALLARLP